MRTEHYEMDGDRVSPIRPDPMYRLKADKATYDGPRPPCQLVPWLLSTPGTLFCVKGGPGMYPQVVQTQLFGMQQAGLYLWAKRSKIHPHLPLWWKNDFTRGPMFELGMCEDMADYKPEYVTPMARASVDMLDCQWLNWRRNGTVLWAAPRGEYDYD